ncbi:predicted protein [Phaeodactylum tricornutum CCAP 1055/1]|uniref:Uncharacterized protein n=1 Tax=Phaeodactylum tricornutum (strain CCAP 1055/1) TaxID=556484 RepID=B7G2X9_PHATC|nr:predicted protein [Phaeodactylum tricornutum CCAP 1055/1]EEC47385.1 predicted protein [Phaeodactylum tricornutum CCAP 1055/1]|eukprot:XP_002181462.1 predicted protein [Phaeodactylum tricornutum CCAP 1055/1]
MCLDQPLAQAFQLSVFTTPISSLYNLGMKSPSITMSDLWTRGLVVLATPEPWEQHSVTKKTLRRTRKRCTYALVVLLGIVGLLGVTLGITNRTNSRTESQTTAITATDGTTTGDANGNSDNLDGDTNNALSVSQTSHVIAWPVATSCLDEPFRPLVRVSCGATETVRIRTVQNANRTLTSDRTNVATCVPNQLANSARLAVAFGTVPAPCRGPSAPSKRCCPRRSLPTPPITLRTNPDQSCEGMLTEILDPIMGLNPANPAT